MKNNKDNVIVPFVFNLYEYLGEKPMFLWVFYKFLTFCLKYNMPIIAQEELFVDPKIYADKKHWAIEENNTKDLCYKIPTKEELDKIEKIIITKSHEEKITSKYTNKFNVWVDILQTRNKDFENIINFSLNKILINHNIDAIISWVYFPSLDYCCKKMNIKLIQMEFSSIRQQGIYNTTLGYFCFNNKYDQKQVRDNYTKVKGKIERLFSRKELLSIFLKKEYVCNYVTKMSDSPKYEIGFGPGLKNDPYEKIYSNYETEEILKILKKIYNNEQISVRSHPAYPFDFSKFNYNVDVSPNSAEWILNCKKIISNVSNVGYEAMLLGKTSCILSENMPFSYNTTNTLDVIDENIVSIEYLNYLTFGFFSPYDLMFDLDYIKFRLNTPDPLEIYNFNLNYLLEKKGLSNIFNNNNNKLKFILQKYCKFDSNTVNYILNYNCNSKVSELENILKFQNSTIDTLNMELQKIFNSNGWKLLQKIRKIKSIFIK